MAPTGPRIILACCGSLGDLHPFLAVAQALKARGARPMLATSPGFATIAADAGLEAEAIHPGVREMLDYRGLSPDDALHRVMHDAGFVFDFVYPYTLEAVRRLDELAGDAAVITGHSIAFAGELVAARRNIPFVPISLHPYSTMSAHDPPLMGRFRAFRLAPKTPPALWWNRLVRALIHRGARKRFGPQANLVRAACGLPPVRGAPLAGFEPGHPLMLGLYSPLLSPAQPDLPHMVVTGAPFFDPPGEAEAMDTGLAAFMDSGPAPLVFTLGSAAVAAPGDFYGEAAAAARALGWRAVLVGAPAEAATGGDVFAAQYVPHGLVFPNAAAVIHQGGVGTLARAIAAARPQLVVPHMFDQFDNARRVRRLGLGDALDAARFTAANATPRLARILDDPAIAQRCTDAGRAIAAERGADTAAQQILALAQRNA